MTINRIPALFAVFGLLFVIQEAVINRINFLVGGFSLYLAFFIAWVMQEERNSAVVTGFIAGLVADLSPTLEAPFGLWTFVLTVMSYFLATNVRAALDSDLSPVVMSFITVAGTTVSLTAFLIAGAILGQDVGSAGYIFRELLGNGIWSLLLSPLYAPIAVRMYRTTLSPRNR